MALIVCTCGAGREVSSLKVKCVETPYGVTSEAWEEVSDSIARISDNLLVVHV